MRINKSLWENYELFARARGQLVVNILSHYLEMKDAAILDFGCGTGGISIESAAAGARVTAFDVSDKKLNALRQHINATSHVTIVQDLPTHPNFYDAILLSDVIEHLSDPENVLQKLTILLKPQGLVYLSTPNKLSFLNALVDPHFSLPLFSLLKRKSLKLILADFLKWQPKDRMDFPELLSLQKLATLLKKSGFTWRFVNSRVSHYAFQHPEAVWNRNSHLYLIRLMHRIRAVPFIENKISDEIDMFNRWLNPTWYIIAKKKPDSQRRVGLT